MKIISTQITRAKLGKSEHLDDFIAVEAPLQISLKYTTKEQETVLQPLSVTMRTPGEDNELGMGFLLTEGILKSFDEVEKISLGFNEVLFELKKGSLPNINQTERNFYMTSSCGVCGKSSIDAIIIPHNYDLKSFSFSVKEKIISELPQHLRQAQKVFAETGGIHAAGIFNNTGEMMVCREDVGRHNAVDKVIGYSNIQGQSNFDKHILVVSGRISFELVQKAAVAGIAMMVAVGAPSSLAIELAKEKGITLVGFVKQSQFNIYSDFGRII